MSDDHKDALAAAFLAVEEAVLRQGEAFKRAVEATEARVDRMLGAVISRESLDARLHYCREMYAMGRWPIEMLEDQVEKVLALTERNDNA